MNSGIQNIRWTTNGKLKLLIIVGTCPEIIRMAAAIEKCRMYNISDKVARIIRSCTGIVNRMVWRRG